MLKTHDSKSYILNSDFKNSPSKDFIYISSINMYVAKERKFFGENWFECHKKLQENRERMLIIPEFIEFLKHIKKDNLAIYNEMIQAGDSWKAEWLDANFKLKNDKLHINYNHKLDSNGNLIPKNSEILDKNTLMQDEKLGISLENWLEGSTNQGLPIKCFEDGILHYWHPRSDNNLVAWFNVVVGKNYLNCCGNPFYVNSDLGVRAVKIE